MRAINCILILLTICRYGQSHETNVHANISDAAVDYLKSLDPHRFDQFGPTFSTGTGDHDLKTLLRIGAKGEDDDGPGLRFMFHFLPALSGSINLGAGLTVQMNTTCDSADWARVRGALSPQYCTYQIISPITQAPVTLRNSHRWVDAQQSTAENGVPSETGWIDLGYVIHLLEDLTSPAHTRNVPHPCQNSHDFSLVRSLPLNLIPNINAGRCEIYERYNGYFVNRYDAGGHLTTSPIDSGLPLGAIPGTPSAKSIGSDDPHLSLLGAPNPWILTSPLAFFASLGDFVRQRFYSTYSTFDPTQAGPGLQNVGPNQWIPDPSLISTDLQGVYDLGPCLGPALIDPACHSLTPGTPGRLISRQDLQYKLSKNIQLMVGDETIAQEQFLELGPIAVEYVAAFIHFYAPKVTVSVDTSNAFAGTGLISSKNLSADCLPGQNSNPNPCSFLVVNGTTVQLTAKADPGALFGNWGGDCANASSTIDQNGTSSTVTLTAATDVYCTATFGKTMTVKPFGIGTVTSTPVGINCGSQCTSSFAGSVTLNASPISDFLQWDQDCVGTNPSILVVLDVSKTCAAIFKGGQLTVIKGSDGVVTSSPSGKPTGIACGQGCITQSALFKGSVTLTATPAANFVQWSGSCAGTNPIVTIDVESNLTCTANFIQEPSAVRLNPSGHITFDSNPGPYEVEAVDSQLNPVVAPRDITVTLNRDVISGCNGPLFSSPRTVVISQGQSFGTFGEVAGLDPDCRSVAIATNYTLLQAADNSGKVFDLTGVPPSQQTLYILRSPGGGGGGGCGPCQVEIDINGTPDKSDDITLLNPPQPIAAAITLLSGGPGVQVQLAVTPSSRATLDRSTVTLAQGSIATVNIIPRQVSTSANDVTLTATVNGVVVGIATLTVVDVSLSSLDPSGNPILPGRIRASDTPMMMTPDRIPPGVDTPVGVFVQPNLTGSGQWVTLYEANASPQNGTFTIAGNAGLTPGAGWKVISSQTVNLRGVSQTTPTSGNGGGNAGNLALGVAVRSQPVLQSAGFSVAAIPVGMIGRLIGNCTVALCGSGYDGIVVGYDVFPETNITYLDQVTILEQVQVVAATGALTPLLSNTNTTVQTIPGPATGTFTDRHDIPTVDLTGTGTSLSAQVFIFNDLRTGVTNIPIPASGFNITRIVSADNSGDFIVRTSIFGQGATANGYTTSAGQTTSPVLSGTQP